MALNHWVGMGRLTAKPELKTTPSGVSVATFTIAVDRDYKSQSGEKQTDFIQIVAWRQTAEFVTKYFDKGSLICVEGSLQVRSYNAQDGSKRFITEIMASGVHFTGEKRETATTPAEAYAQLATPQSSNFETLSTDDELPF